MYKSVYIHKVWAASAGTGLEEAGMCAAGSCCGLKLREALLQCTASGRTYWAALPHVAHECAARVGSAEPVRHCTEQRSE